MRVALVVERFEPRAGGVEAVAWRVAHGLAAAGDEVCVVARQAAASKAVRVLPVRVPAFWQPLRVLAFSGAAARAAPRGGFDVVHSFSRTRHQDLYRAGGGSHADYLERTYGASARWRRLSPRHATLLALERSIFSDPSQLIQCNSRMVRDEIARRNDVPPERLEVVYNGVDLERFHPGRRAREGVRLRAEWAPAGPVWLLAGSGLRRKGLDTALDALARSAAGNAELWVAGRDAPGPWARLAARLGVEQRVRFLGGRSDLERVYAAADALVLPTRYDAFANVCLEAAAAGLPVVTSAHNGAAEILGDAGFVIQHAEDAAGFAKALDALADPGLRERLGARARQIAERHGWSSHVAALRALYARVAR